MDKYEVLKEFRDVHTGETYKPNQELEWTEERANEAIKNLSKWDGPFLKKSKVKKTLNN